MLVAEQLARQDESRGIRKKVLSGKLRQSRASPLEGWEDVNPPRNSTKAGAVIFL
jgi:hypothetical protein